MQRPSARCEGRTLTPYPCGFGVRSGAVFKASSAKTSQLCVSMVSSLERSVAFTLPVIASYPATSVFIPPARAFVKRRDFPLIGLRAEPVPVTLPPRERRFYFLPVLPKPPAPLSVPPSSTDVSSRACVTAAKIICAMRSPDSIVKSFSPKFARITRTSPR